MLFYISSNGVTKRASCTTMGLVTESSSSTRAPWVARCWPQSRRLSSPSLREPLVQRRCRTANWYRLNRRCLNLCLRWTYLGRPVSHSRFEHFPWTVRHGGCSDRCSCDRLGHRHGDVEDVAAECFCDGLNLNKNMLDSLIIFEIHKSTTIWATYQVVYAVKWEVTRQMLRGLHRKRKM